MMNLYETQQFQECVDDAEENFYLFLMDMSDRDMQDELEAIFSIVRSADDINDKYAQISDRYYKLMEKFAMDKYESEKQ